MRFTIAPDASRMTAFLLKITAALFVLGVLASYAVNAWGVPKDRSFIRLLDLDREANIPAVFSALIIWCSALLLWIIYRERRNTHKKEAVRWKAMSLVFLFLGFDELLLIHESTKGISQFLSACIQVPVRDMYWTLSYGLLLILFAAFFFRFYFSLPRATRIRFAVAGAVYVGGAIGVEILGAMYVKQVLDGSYNPPVGWPAFGYNLFVAVEEVMEMTGIVLFIRALLMYIRHMPTWPVLTILLEKRSGDDEAAVQST